MLPGGDDNARSPLDPTYCLATHPQRIGSIQQLPFRTLQHPPLLDQVLQDRPPLRNVVVDAVFAFLQERVFAKCEIVARVIGLIERRG